MFGMSTVVCSDQAVQCYAFESSIFFFYSPIFILSLPLSYPSFFLLVLLMLFLQSSDGLPALPSDSALSESRDKQLPSKVSSSSRRRRRSSAVSSESLSESSVQPDRRARRVPLAVLGATHETEKPRGSALKLEDDGHSKKGDFLEQPHERTRASNDNSARGSFSSGHSRSTPVFLGDDLANRPSHDDLSSASSSSSDCESVGSSASSSSSSGMSTSLASSPEMPFANRTASGLAIPAATALSMTDASWEHLATPPPPTRPAPCLEGFSEDDFINADEEESYEGQRSLGEVDDSTPPPPMRPAPCLDYDPDDGDDLLYPLPPLADELDPDEGDVFGGEAVGAVAADGDEIFYLPLPGLNPVYQENRNQMVLDSTGILSPIHEAVSEGSLSLAASERRSQSRGSFSTRSTGELRELASASCQHGSQECLSSRPSLADVDEAKVTLVTDSCMDNVAASPSLESAVSDDLPFISASTSALHKTESTHVTKDGVSPESAEPSAHTSCSTVSSRIQATSHGFNEYRGSEEDDDTSAGEDLSQPPACSALGSDAGCLEPVCCDKDSTP